MGSATSMTEPTTTTPVTTEAPAPAAPTAPVTTGEGGVLGNITNSLADQISSGTKGAVSSVTVAKATPFLMGGVGALAGTWLIEPATKIGKMAFSGLRSLVTGFGKFEKIPGIGFLFKGAGEALDTIGDYAGNALPVLGGVLGYKLFEAQSRTPFSPAVNLGRIGRDPTVEKVVVTTPDTRPSTTVHIPQPAKEQDLTPEIKLAAEVAAGRSKPTIPQALASRLTLQEEKKYEQAQVLETYLQHELQVYEHNKKFAKSTAFDREHDTITGLGLSYSESRHNLIMTYGLTDDEVKGFLPQSPVLRETLYAKGDHQPHAAFTPLTQVQWTQNGPLADFARAFQNTYGQGLKTVDDGKGKQVALPFDEMSTSQQLEFLDKALRFAKDRKKAILEDLEYNAQHQSYSVSLNSNSLLATNGIFNYMEMHNGPFEKVYGMTAYEEAIYDPRTEVGMRQDYTPAPPKRFFLKMVPGSQNQEDLVGITTVKATELPLYAIPRSVEHDFIMSIDGVGPNLTGDQGPTQIIPYLPFSTIRVPFLTDNSSHDQYDNCDVSLGKLDGITVRGHGNYAKASFTSEENGNPNNLMALFSQWQQALQAHHEEMGKAVEAYTHQTEEFIKVKKELLKKSGLALISSRMENEIETLRIVDTRTGIRYQLHVDQETHQITEFSSNGKDFHAFSMHMPYKADNAQSVFTSLPAVIKMAEPVVLKEQKKSARETSKIDILERSELPAVEGKPPIYSMVIQDTTPLPPGKKPSQFRITYNANGEILELQVKEPGREKFENTSASNSLHNKIKHAREAQHRKLQGYPREGDKLLLEGQLDFDATHPGVSSRALIDAYTREMGLVRERLRPAPDIQQQRQKEANAAGLDILETGVGTYKLGDKEIDSPYVIVRALDDQKKPTGQTYKIYYNEFTQSITRVERKDKDSDPFQQVDMAAASTSFGPDPKPAAFVATLKTYLEADQKKQKQDAVAALTPADLTRDLVQKKHHGVSAVKFLKPSLMDPSKTDTYLDVGYLSAEGKPDDSKTKFKIELKENGQVKQVYPAPVDKKQREYYKKASSQVLAEMPDLAFDSNHVDEAKLRQLLDKIEARVPAIMAAPPAKIDPDVAVQIQLQQLEANLTAVMPTFRKAAAPAKINKGDDEKVAYLEIFSSTPFGEPDETKPQYRIFHDENGSVRAIQIKTTEGYICNGALNEVLIKLQMKEAATNCVTLPLNDPEKLKATIGMVMENVDDVTKERTMESHTSAVIDSAALGAILSTCGVNPATTTFLPFLPQPTTGQPRKK